MKNKLNKSTILLLFLLLLAGCGDPPQPAPKKEIVTSKFANDLAETLVADRYRQMICDRYQQHPEMGAKLVQKLLASEDEIQYIYAVELDSSLSVEELKELNRFFNSELGEKYLNIMARVNNKMFNKESELKQNGEKNQLD